MANKLFYWSDTYIGGEVDYCPNIKFKNIEKKRYCVLVLFIEC